MEIAKDYLLELIRKEGIVAAYDPQEVLFHKGEVPEFLFYLRNGTVVLIEASDPVHPVAQFSMGNLIGVHELITGATYRFSAITEISSSLLMMNKDRFEDLFQQDVTFRMSVVKLISSEMTGMKGSYE